MEGFDDAGIFFSDNFGGDEQQDANLINLQQVKNKFKNFIRTFNEDNFIYKYRYEPTSSLLLYNNKQTSFQRYIETPLFAAQILPGG